MILVAANLVGMFIHNLTEEGQRRAFLDTRDCIAARLEMEDENEKLERLLLSVLPQHVAIEMKADIMSPVEVRRLLATMVLLMLVFLKLIGK